MYKVVRDLCYKLAEDVCSNRSSLGTWEYINTCDQIEKVKGLCFNLKQYIEDMKDSSTRTVHGHKCGREDVQLELVNSEVNSDKATV